VSKRIRVPLPAAAKESAAVSAFIVESRALLNSCQRQPDADERRRTLKRLVAELPVEFPVAVVSERLERYIHASVDPGDLEELRQSLDRLEAEHASGGAVGAATHRVRVCRDRVLLSYMGQLRPPEDGHAPETGVPRKPRPVRPPGSNTHSP
jgi:hypothetical protein